MTVLFGGVRDSATLTDTWEWDGVQWFQRAPSVSPSQNGLLAYDAAHYVTVLFTTSGETWTWDGIGWTEMTPTVSPPWRTDGAMAFDAAIGRIVLFGGWGATGQLADTWEWDGSTWTHFNPAVSPQARYSHALGYDARTGRIILFGGSTQADGGGVIGDTWSWDGASWTDLTPANSPSPRRNSAIDWDPGQNAVVLFGGADQSGYLRDTWEWDGSNWVPVAPAVSATCGFRSAMAADSLRRSVLFGGYCDGFMGDTWIGGAPDAPIQLTGKTISVRKKTPFFGTMATIGDGDARAVTSDYTATISWGDATTTACPSVTCTFASSSPATFTINATHTWLKQGTYTVLILLADRAGASATATASVIVQADNGNGNG
jgi:hypothetical protein